MLNGLDLFSGIGGLSLALAPWVRPIAYCENDRYAQSVLLSRMHDGHLETAPIWDDISTLDAISLPLVPDIIYGGFPCQDISVAGRGKGLEGERSSLFLHVARLAKEIEPAFIFLENVPAIRTRGLGVVIEQLAGLGFDCRWTTLSAAEVGAPHLRKRWFCLAAHPERVQLWNEPGWGSGAKGTDESVPRDHGVEKPLANSDHLGQSQSTQVWNREGFRFECGGQVVADAQGVGWRKGNAEHRGRPQRNATQKEWNGPPIGSQGLGDADRQSLAVGLCERDDPREKLAAPFGASWWATEPGLDRVVNGVPHRVDRLHGLGNSVVPAQAREAFKRLLGLD